MTIVGIETRVVSVVLLTVEGVGTGANDVVAVIFVIAVVVVVVVVDTVSVVVSMVADVLPTIPAVRLSV